MMQPFYFFADLVDYFIQGNKGKEVRRTVVVKKMDETQELAIINLKRFYKAAYCTRGDDKNNIIPATLDDWLTFQAMINRKPVEIEDVEFEPVLTGRTCIDITGQRFGLLTAKKRNHLTNSDLWLFECDCGTTKELSKRNVKNGSTISCGCLNREQDISGNRYGKLLAVKKHETNGIWIFKCDCGKIKELRKRSVLSGNTLSCGCLRIERLKARIES